MMIKDNLLLTMFKLAIVYKNQVWAKGLFGRICPQDVEAGPDVGPGLDGV